MVSSFHGDMGESAKVESDASQTAADWQNISQLQSGVLSKHVVNRARRPARLPGNQGR
jgi:hypothetical protein